jgi:hypothetical protein
MRRVNKIYQLVSRPMLAFTFEEGRLPSVRCEITEMAARMSPHLCEAELSSGCERSLRERKKKVLAEIDVFGLRYGCRFLFYFLDLRLLHQLLEHAVKLGEVAGIERAQGLLLKDCGTCGCPLVLLLSLRCHLQGLKICEPTGVEILHRGVHAREPRENLKRMFTPFAKRLGRSVQENMKTGREGIHRDVCGSIIDHFGQPYRRTLSGRCLSYLAHTVSELACFLPVALPNCGPQLMFEQAKHGRAPFDIRVSRLGQRGRHQFARPLKIKISVESVELADLNQFADRLQYVLWLRRTRTHDF